MTAIASTPRRLRRRSFAAFVAASALLPPARAQDRPLLVCQSVDLGGPLADLGQAMSQGAKACFARVNAAGGVHGRSIQLVTVDDGYNTERAVANVRGFMDDPACFALFNCMGTPAVEAMLPHVMKSGVPFFAPFTGALVARRKDARNVFNVRASYADEAEQLVRHLSTIGIRDIGIASLKNAFGQEVLGSVQASTGRYGIRSLAAATVQTDASDAQAVAAQLAQGTFGALLVALAGKPTIEFVRAIRKHKRGLPLYALSVVGSAATVRTLGDDGVGMTISQVMPSPANTTMAVVREFREAWRQSGTTLEPSHLALEGYVNARVFAEALRRAGPNPSRAAFIDSTWKLRNWDVGGMELSFTEPGGNASRFVELTMVGKGGQFIR